MKKYINPTTQMMTIVYGTSLMISIGETGDDPTNAEAPLRQFTGDKQSLKYLI